MRTTRTSVMLGILLVATAGCASKQVAQQRGWVGGEFLVAKRPSWTTPTGDPLIVPAFPEGLLHDRRSAILVSGVYSNTPLALAGIQEGDLILAVDGQRVEKLSTFRHAIDRAKPGSTVTLGLFHDGQLEERAIRIGRETYKRWRTIALGLGLRANWELDLIPDPEFSLIALGYTRDEQRAEINSPRNRFIRRHTQARRDAADEGAESITSESWRTWLAVLSFGGYHSILSQEAMDSTTTVLWTK